MSVSKDLITNILSQRYEQLLLEEKHCDCSFVLGEERNRIRCHRIILAAASPVFEAMFYGPMKYIENGGSTPGIEILDISENIFRRLILYIYKGYLDLRTFTLEETIELYYAAEKYLLSDLVKKCLEAVALKLRFDNILPTLELSVCLDLSNLLTICLNFFKRCCLGNGQFTAYLKHNYNHQISKECLEVIVNYLHQFGQTQNQARCLQFIYEWNRHALNDCSINETKKPAKCESFLPQTIHQLIRDNCNTATKLQIINSMDVSPSKSIERCFYRACRPWTISEHSCQWFARIKCDTFMALHGLIIYSRQSPTVCDLVIPKAHISSSTSYSEENLLIEVKSVLPPSANSNSVGDNPVAFKWNHRVINKSAMYNCFFNIKWTDIVILSPDVQYEIRFIWQPLLCSGVEYTTGLLERDVGGFHFEDCDLDNGSLLKGLHIVKLV